jgi:hypothetical protein
VLRLATRAGASTGHSDVHFYCPRRAHLLWHDLILVAQTCAWGGRQSRTCPEYPAFHINAHPAMHFFLFPFATHMSFGYTHPISPPIFFSPPRAIPISSYS